MNHLMVLQSGHPAVLVHPAGFLGRVHENEAKESKGFVAFLQPEGFLQGGHVDDAAGPARLQKQGYDAERMVHAG